jgi:hypothetical protein
LIAEALSDLGGLRCSGVRALEIPAEHVLQHSRYQQIAALDRVTLLAFEQPSRAREPSQGGARLSPERQVVADPERAAHGPRRLAGVQVGVMCPLEAAHIVVVAPEHVGGPRQQLEVLRLQRRRLIGVG